MSTHSKNIVRALMITLTLGFSSLAVAGENVDSWIGTVSDLNGSHDPNDTNDHPLKFTRASDGESYFISSGDEEIQKEHARTDKTLEAKVDGRITSKFLFFGGNLIVSKFVEIAELDPIVHKRLMRSRDLDPPGRRNR